MQIKLRTLLLALPLLAAACDDAPETAGRPASRMIDVVIGSGRNIDILSAARPSAAIGSDGETFRWNEEDRIAFWAADATDGSPVFEARSFALYHYNAAYNEARFTGSVPEMASGTYNYYAVSPEPESHEGTRATYTLPAIQRFEAASLGEAYTRLPYDIMTADPIANAEALAQGDNSDRVNLTFRHKIHLLKLTVANNRMGEPISKIELAFPEPVAGRITLDAAAPDAAPELTEGSKTLTLQFDTPVEAGTTVYAAIAPVDLSGEEITIKAFCQAGVSYERSFSPANAFAAGHTTPIRYTVPQIEFEYTTDLVFRLARNFLGEAVRSITLTAPEGGTFDNGSDVRECTPDADGTFTVSLPVAWIDNLSGKTVSARFESEHAIVEGAIAMPGRIERYATNPIDYSVPYLFEETFDAVESFSSNDGYTSGFLSGSKGAYSFLSGWTGGRIGASAGLSIRVACRRETSAGYAARVDSAPLANLKEGASVKVSVAFDYGMDRQDGGLWPTEIGQTCHMGYVKEPTAFASGDETGTFVSNFYIKETGASWDNLPHKDGAFDFDGCDNTTRLTWRTVRENKAGTNNNTCWLYLDNIRVSIAQ